MGNSDKEFSAKLEEARVWEKKVARWARRRGWYVIPSYDFSGKGDNKAPKMMAPPDSADLVLPDLQCFRDGTIRWLEVKYKSRADLYRKTGELVTGISLRLWGHYLEVEAQTNGDVFLMFLHEKEHEIRGDKIQNLRGYIHHEYRDVKMGRGGMIFWGYSRLPMWGQLGQLVDG